MKNKKMNYLAIMFLGILLAAIFTFTVYQVRAEQYSNDVKVFTYEKGDKEFIKHVARILEISEEEAERLINKKRSEAGGPIFKDE